MTLPTACTLESATSWLDVLGDPYELAALRCGEVR
jgi:hypothetical protein